jgi:head-tail adaptor
MPAKMMEWPSANLDPGAMVHKIQIQAQSSNQDEFGQPGGWYTLWTCWAARTKTERQMEVYETGLFTSRITYEFTIYWPGSAISIVPGMQLLLGSDVYNIQTIENVDERDILLRLMVLEINAPS